MALTGDLVLTRRGGAVNRNEFGYPVAAGEVVYRGGLVGLNAAGNIQRIQTTANGGVVVLLGLSDRTLDNTQSAIPSATLVVPSKGSWGLSVPNATPSNIGAAVYAVDDGTVTLTQNAAAPFLLQAGVLSGIEAGATFVTISGS